MDYHLAATCVWWEVKPLSYLISLSLSLGRLYIVTRQFVGAFVFVRLAVFHILIMSQHTYRRQRQTVIVFIYI